MERAVFDTDGAFPYVFFVDVSDNFKLDDSIDFDDLVSWTRRSSNCTGEDDCLDTCYCFSAELEQDSYDEAEIYDIVQSLFFLILFCVLVSIVNLKLGYRNGQNFDLKLCLYFCLQLQLCNFVTCVVMGWDDLFGSLLHSGLSLELFTIILGWYLCTQQWQLQMSRYFSINGTGAIATAGAAVSATIFVLGMQMRGLYHNNNGNVNNGKGLWYFYDSTKQQQVCCSKDIGDKFTNMIVGHTVS